MRQETLMEVARLKLELQNRNRIKQLNKQSKQSVPTAFNFEPVEFVEAL
jgi:hypothetical protein